MSSASNANQGGLAAALGGFLSSFTQARTEKENKVERDKKIKLETQLFEIQMREAQARMDAAEKSQAAQQRFGDIVTGVTRDPSGRGRQGPFDFGGPDTGGPNDPLQEIGTPGIGIDELSGNLPAMLAGMQSGQLDIGDMLKERGVADRAGNRQANIEAVLGDTNNPTDNAGNKQFLYAPGIGANGEVTLAPHINPAYQLPQSEALERNEITTAFTRVQKSIQRNMQLATGQPLQATGSPFKEAGSLFGRGAEAVTGVVNQFTGRDAENPFADATTAAAMQVALDKDFAVSMFSSAELDTLLEQGRITLAQWNQLKTSNPGLENPWPVNANIQLDQLELKLNNADVLGINVSNESDIRDYIRTMREVVGPELELLEQGGGGKPTDTPNKPTFTERASETLGGLKDQATDIAGQVGGFAKDTAIPFAQDKAGQAKAFASASFDDLMEIDFRGLASDAQVAAQQRWDQVVSKLPIEELQAMDLKNKTEDQLLSIRLQFMALKELAEKEFASAKDK